MDELRVEVALEIIQHKIVNFIKNYKGKDKTEFKEKLKKLTDEREKIYDLDEETINKMYDVYLKEIKEERCKKNG